MRTKITVISGALVVWTVSSAAGFAFEQTPIAPAQAPAVKTQQEASPKFDGEATKLEPQKKSGGLKIPGLGKLSIPKLNFGLDLMYGSPENDATDLGFTGDTTGDGDMTILGTVKRRF